MQGWFLFQLRLEFVPQFLDPIPAIPDKTFDCLFSCFFSGLELKVEKELKLLSEPQPLTYLLPDLLFLSILRYKLEIQLTNI